MSSLIQSIAEAVSKEPEQKKPIDEALSIKVGERANNKRAEGLVRTASMRALRTAINEIAEDMRDDGFEDEDIHGFLASFILQTV